MESELLQIFTQGGAVGVLAVIVMLFIFGWIVSKQTYDRASDTFKESLNRLIEADREERQADRERGQQLLDLLKSINGRFKEKK